MEDGRVGNFSYAARNACIAQISDMDSNIRFFSQASGIARALDLAAVFHVVQIIGGDIVRHVRITHMDFIG
jgi:hypothetical protein